MQTADLIFEAGTVMLVDDRRRDEHEQVAFHPRIKFFLEKIADDWDIAQQRNFGVLLVHLVLEQAANGQRISALDQNVGIEAARVDDRTGYGGTGESESRIADLVTDLGLNRQRDEVVLIHGGVVDQWVAEFLV